MSVRCLWAVPLLLWCGSVAVSATNERPAVLGPGGLSAEMWDRVRAIQPAAIDLSPVGPAEVPPSLSLRECIAIALRHNASFRQEQERLVSARRALWVALQRLGLEASSRAERAAAPGEEAETTLSASLEATWRTLWGGSLESTLSTGTQNSVGEILSRRPSLTLQYEQPLLRGFGRASSTAERIRKAWTALAAQELSFWDAYQDLVERIVSDYCAVLLARGEEEIARRAAERAKQLYEINYAKFTGEGLVQPGEEWVSQVAEIDVDQARLSWERAQQQVISRQQAFRDAMDRLLLDMGAAPGATPELTTQIVYAPQQYEEAALVETALRNSTTLGRLELTRQDRLAELLIARSEDQPEVTAALGVVNPGETASETSPGTGWFTSLRVTVPFLDRGRQERVAAAERALAVLEQQIVGARERVRQEVAQQVRAALSAQARIAIGERSVALARKSREAAQGMYDEGLSDYLRVLDAEDRLVQAESSLLQEQIQYFQTTVRLKRAVGENILDILPE